MVLPSASKNFKLSPPNKQSRAQTNVSKNSTNSDATHTQIKPTPQQFPPLWVKLRSLTCATSLPTLQSTSPPPSQCKTLGANCCNPLASKSLMTFRSKLPSP